MACCSLARLAQIRIDYVFAYPIFLCLLADNGPCLFFCFLVLGVLCRSYFCHALGLFMLLAVTLAGSLSFCFRVYVVVVLSEPNYGYANMTTNITNKMHYIN
jgi:hypothetical protein